MRQLTVNQIVNRVAVAVGLDSVSSPYDSTDRAMIQLMSMLQDAGDELVQLHDWEILKREHSLTTDGSTSYSLPSDFDRMVPQTHWDRTRNLPVAGPLSAQDWQYLKGRDISATTIYASFRQREGSLFVFPQSTTGVDIYFEYIGTGWLYDVSASNARVAAPTAGDDIVLFDSTLVRSYLRAKYLQSKGFDTVSPESVATEFFLSRISKDEQGPILSAGGNNRGFPYLDGVRNVPDTGYGS